MPSINFISVVVACAISSAHAFSDYSLAPRVEINAPLAERASFIGGWALGGGITTCPADTVSCTDQSDTCCPTSATCVGQGNFGGMACCPSKTNCGQAILSIPACANSTWTLYRGSSHYFCCEPGQIGVFSRSSLITFLVGLCVPGDQNVPESNLATAVGGIMPKTSAALASTTEALVAATSTAATVPTVAASSASSAPSAAATTTTTTTKSAGVSNVVTLVGVSGLAFGCVLFQLLL